MNETSIVILCAILGSSAFTTIVSHICVALENRFGKGNKMKEIEKKLVKQEKDSVRLQLLLMISDYPNEVHEIMTLGEYYFKTLGSNWYMTGLFNAWLEKNGIAKPEWFKHPNQ